MCGIAGFLGGRDESLLRAMAEKLAHRGPDNLSVEYHAQNQLGLAHTRLSIIDLSNVSNQPLWNATKTHCITFNGEIYNYRELKSKLIEKGYTFNSNGDTEVLLNLYIEHGVAAFSMLNGIFAFALWDSLDQAMIVARDPLGIKPLYYSQTKTGFVFSSEIKSLLCDQTISREIDRTALSHYLRFLWCPSPRTPLTQVQKLEAGNFLLIRNGRIQNQTRYYALPRPSPIDMTAKDCEGMLMETLECCVERQLVADVQVGAFLSGGLDSSAVVALAAKRLGPENLPCFTIDFEKASDEGIPADLPYAKRVAKHLGVPLQIVHVKPDIINDLSKLVFQLDEPQADLAPLNVLYISKLAREQGIKVLLSGAGGDDLLTGYRRHYALMQERYWSWLPMAGRQFLKCVSSKLPKRDPRLRRIAKAFDYADRDGDDRLVSYFYWLDPQSMQDLFAEPFEPSDPLRDHVRALPNPMSRLQKMLELDTRFFLIDHNFNYTDKMSMAEGVEVRVPLVDLEMVAAAARIPDCFKQNGKHGKWIFKKTMESLLPHDVIYRPKSGFGAPVRQWLQNELRPVVDEILSEDSIRRRGIFNPQKVRELVRADREGKVDAAYTVLSLMNIELWCKQFVDPPVPRASI